MHQMKWSEHSRRVDLLVKKKIHIHKNLCKLVSVTCDEKWQNVKRSTEN